MDIEENINKLKARFLNIKWIYSNRLGLTKTQYEDIKQLINDILAEREADKKKIDKLQVLEDDLKDKRIVYVDTPEFEEKFIPKQKVKDLVENETINISGFRCIALEDIERLLEDK